jgi:hypothetical protein
VCFKYQRAEVAQSVEQGTENPRVGGSIPSLGTSFCLKIREYTKLVIESLLMVRLCGVVLRKSFDLQRFIEGYLRMLRMLCPKLCPFCARTISASFVSCRFVTMRLAFCRSCSLTML